MGDLFNRLDREDKPSAIEGQRKLPDCCVGVSFDRKDLSARKVAEAAAMTGNKRPGPHNLARWAGRLNDDVCLGVSLMPITS